MPRRPQQSKSTDGNITCSWTDKMDDNLIDTYLHQHTIGNRVGGTFTTHVMDNIVQEMKEKYPEKPINKERIHNRMKNIKKNFTPCYDIFKNGMSGFAWNPVTEMWSAEAEVWKILIETKPEAAMYVNKRVRNYEKLVELFGQDRATGQHVETAEEIRTRRAKNNDSANYDPNSIDGVDFMVSQNEAVLEDTDVHVTDDECVELPRMSRFHCSSKVSGSSRPRKATKQDLNDEVIYVREGLELVANAILQSTNEMVKTKDPIKDCDIWSLLEEIGVEEIFRLDSYIFLSENPEKFRMVIRCPIEHRKNLLMKLMDRHNLS